MEDCHQLEFSLTSQQLILMAILLLNQLQTLITLDLQPCMENKHQTYKAFNKHSLNKIKSSQIMIKQQLINHNQQNSMMSKAVVVLAVILLVN